MRVGFYLADQNPQRDRSLGITAYTDALLRQLRASPDLALSALQSRSSYAAPGTDIQRHTLPFRTDHVAGRLFADQMHPILCRPAVDLWHYPKGFLPLALRYPGPVVGTVCDVILQHYADRYPESRKASDHAYWLLMLRRSIPRFDLILTISHFSKHCILEFCHRYGLHAPPIVVTYLACDWQTARLAPKEQFVVHLASTQPYKRTATLLEFWRELEMGDAAGVELDLIGPLLEADRAAAQRLKSVRISDRLPRPELDQRLARARALIFPSEIEGFGLPALEAYAAATPVVYVQGTTVEEILGKGTPGGFSLASFESFRVALDEVLQMREETIAIKAQQLRQRFSWSRCAEETLAAYKSLI